MAKQEHKKLYRSREYRVFAGILSGLGEYFDVDPVLLRLVFIVLLVFTGFFPFGIIYTLAWIIIPLEGSYTKNKVKTGTVKKKSTKRKNKKSEKI